MVDFFQFPGAEGIGAHYDKFVDEYVELMEKSNFYERYDVAKALDALEECKKLKNNEEAVIVDYATGQGHSAVVLKEHGYIPTYGTDSSAKMLEKCPEGIFKKTYITTFSVDPVPSELIGVADLLTICGVVGPMCNKPSYINDILSILKVGGIAAFDTLGKNWADENPNAPYKQDFEVLEKAGKVKLLSKTEVKRGQRITKEEDYENVKEKFQVGLVLVIQKLAE